MDKDLLDALLFVLAVGTAVGNGIAYFFARRELIEQRQETRDLAKLTSDLQVKVNTLSANLDQTIKNLTRARDLTNLLMEKAYALRQESRELPDKLNISVQRQMGVLELYALVSTTHNADLVDTFEELAKSHSEDVWPRLLASKTYTEDDIKIADALIDQLARLTISMHKQILAMLENATKAES